MTSIRIIKSLHGEYKRVTCKGHAGFAKAGSDVVCSAVSMLVINTINSLDVLAGIKLQVDSDEEEGFIDCILLENPGESGRLLLDSMVLGLEMVVSQYGKKYLKLKFEEV
ncbi:ribosomal-processing cysteine protease Prp [Parablautia muri]|uniref:Ribosomal processing cysteine protease Prp n=1 Tax=Parablautia muri TaxID=2320879 RepID=A0A9X5BCF0_9FIRM|nr:ribosomal-processing cysteine protease Prp [Parablautia muri]NBJ91459.1 ribosomal-processing cysteine protease Prp [Parablautia muri]